MWQIALHLGSPLDVPRAGHRRRGLRGREPDDEPGRAPSRLGDRGLRQPQAQGVGAEPAPASRGGRGVRARRRARDAPISWGWTRSRPWWSAPPSRQPSPGTPATPPMWWRRQPGGRAQLPGAGPARLGAVRVHLHQPRLPLRDARRRGIPRGGHPLRARGRPGAGGSRLGRGISEDFPLAGPAPSTAPPSWPRSCWPPSTGRPSASAR